MRLLGVTKRPSNPHKTASRGNTGVTAKKRIWLTYDESGGVLPLLPLLPLLLGPYRVWGADIQCA